ncbi:MAG: phosphotransferase [Pseudomonadota bacterium]
MQTPPLDAWNISASLKALTGGHRNLAFKTSGLRRDLVFKTTRRSESAIAWLAPVHRAAIAAGLRAPEHIPSTRGRLIESGWTCEPFIEGRAAPPEALYALWPAMNALHQSLGALPQRPGFLSSRALLSVETGGDIDLRAMPAKLRHLCREAWSAPAQGAETVIHGDLNASNLLVCEDGRLALLDWDECRRDHAFFDLGLLKPLGPSEAQAILAWEVACSWRLEPQRAKALATRLTARAAHKREGDQP